MHRSIIFMSVLLACLFGLSQQTTKSRRDISFDKDTFSGSGGGGGGSDVTFEDDEDLADMSGSGSGSGEGSGQTAETIIPTYVATINISSQSFSADLADKGSELFHITAKRIRQDLEDLFASLPGEQNVKILSFSQGSLMTTFELQDSGNSHPEVPKQVLVDTLKKGRLGENRVSLTGFAFKPVNTVVKPPRITPTSTTTTSRPPTMCDRMRETRRRLAGSKYLPRCGPNGEFESLQCSKHAGTDDCWCSDLAGVEIPGTRMEAPNFPDCDDGYNMAPCVYRLVQDIRNMMVGSFRPRCALDGQFDRIQCHGSVCFCVYEDSGTRVDGTEVHVPATPNCDDELETIPPPVNGVVDWGKPKEEEEEEKTTVEAPTEPEIVFPKETVPPPFNRYDKDEKTTDRTTEPEIIFPSEGKDSVVVEEGGSKEDGSNTIDISTNYGKNDEDKNSEESEENETGGDSETMDLSERTETKSRVKENTILTQPGLLGGIIGGSVVLLLGLVLLIMFIVYRMRKKDEGSYPLDEPRKSPNYSYVRAPEKEYYA